MVRLYLMEKNVSAHIWVSGTVQGVFFRVEARDQAQKLGLVGWIKNLPSGDVEGYAEGSKTNLEKWIKWCHVGSTRASVTHVKITWGQETKEISSFNIIR